MGHGRRPVGRRPDPRSGTAHDAEGTPRPGSTWCGRGVGGAGPRPALGPAGGRGAHRALGGHRQLRRLPRQPVPGRWDATPEALVGAVERGLLVTDFWYNRVLDPKTQVVTGLTRNGLFLVEEGRIAGPCRTCASPSRWWGASGRAGCGAGRRRPAGGQRGRRPVPRADRAPGAGPSPATPRAERGCHTPSIGSLR